MSGSTLARVASTVVDRDVVMSHGFDFYLNSHQALQGTTRPAHYHVLLDENMFTPDQIQQLTFMQCFLFCRATKYGHVCLSSSAGVLCPPGSQERL
eukprot:scaffold28954_cov44-Prasinocladus_malaysianus.AAC.2